MVQGYPNPLEDLLDLDLARFDAQRRKAACLVTLSAEAEEVHDQAYQRIQEATLLVPKTSVYMGLNIYGSGAILLHNDKGNLIIAVDPEVATLGFDNAGYQAFRRENSGRNVNPRDFLGVVISHEYGHILESEVMQKKHGITYTNDVGLLDMELDLAVGEAFAFWFGDSITGLKTLWLSLMERYRPSVDDSLLAKLHERFSSAEKEHGREYVLRNTAQIVREEVEEHVKAGKTK